MTEEVKKPAVEVPEGKELTPQGVVIDQSPNENWQDDPKLDENGNPKAPVENEPLTADPKPTDEPKDEPLDEPKVEDEAPTAPQFDSKAASDVEAFLTGAGLNPSEVARDVTTNEGVVTPEIMAKLVEKHGEGVAGLIKDKLAGLHQSNVAAAQARDTAVFSQIEAAFKGETEASGKETWGKLAEWAKANVPTAERTEFNQLVAQGGMAAKLAVADLVQTYKNSADYTKPAQLEQGDNLSEQVNKSAISKAEYNKSLNKLLDAGEDYDTSPKIQQLNARRSKSIARGY